MSDPKIDDFTLYVAADGPDGQPGIHTRKERPRADLGFAFGVWNWEVAGGHRSDNIGSVPDQIRMAAAEGSVFGVVVVRANGGTHVEVEDERDMVGGIDEGDPHAMHTTKTIDYDVVVSGKVDLHLPHGKVQTLTPGSMVVIAGVPHAWVNPYEEDCIFVASMVGIDD